MKREENMKFKKKKIINIIFFNIKKIQTTFHQYQKLYSTPHDLVHVPAKFRENTAMPF